MKKVIILIVTIVLIIVSINLYNNYKISHAKKIVELTTTEVETL